MSEFCFILLPSTLRSYLKSLEYSSVHTLTINIHVVFSRLKKYTIYEEYSNDHVIGTLC